VGVERSAHTKQADARRMHVTRGFYPGKGAKHNLGQGQRGQAEAGELPSGSEDLRGLVRRGPVVRRGQAFF
jgi:hypothetical protein